MELNDQQIEALIDEIAGPDWVCPMPMKWNDLYEKLPDTERKQVPIPLILTGWWCTGSSEKKERFMVHLRWARDKSVLDDILEYLKELDETEWLRMGSGPDPMALELTIDEELLQAVEYDDLDGVIESINNGADINATDEYKQSAIQIALQEEYYETVKLLLNYEVELDNELLNKTIAKDQLEIAKLLLERSVKIDGVDKDGWTALTTAAYLSQPDTLRWVLSHMPNVNVNKPDNNDSGLTALHHAACTGEVEKVKILLNAGADIDAKDASGATVKDWARDNGHLDVIQELKAQEID